LKRHEEVAIAKRIERGRLLVLKTITRSPIVIKELMAIAGDLRTGARSIKEIVHFDEEELTEEIIEDKGQKTLKVLDRISTLYNIAIKQAS
jgi:RNA polymerase primary sigma factor